MRIIHPSYQIVDPEHLHAGVGLLKKIERMARISHHAEELQTADSWKRFIQSVVIERGDWSVTEHASATVIFRVDRGVTHELVRHRLFSFTQESTRFVNGRKSYPDGLEFIYPRQLKQTEKPESWMLWVLAMQHAEKAYLAMLDDKTRPQEARSVLPNATAATISMTGNLRSWRWLFLMRTSQETHPDFRAVTLPLLEEFKTIIPILYDDIQPNERQIDNLRKPK